MYKQNNIMKDFFFFTKVVPLLAINVDLASQAEFTPVTLPCAFLWAQIKRRPLLDI